MEEDEGAMFLGESECPPEVVAEDDLEDGGQC